MAISSRNNSFPLPFHPNNKCSTPFSFHTHIRSGARLGGQNDEGVVLGFSAPFVIEPVSLWCFFLGCYAQKSLIHNHHTNTGAPPTWKYLIPQRDLPSCVLNEKFILGVWPTISRIGIGILLSLLVEEDLSYLEFRIYVDLLMYLVCIVVCIGQAELL